MSAINNLRENFDIDCFFMFDIRKKDIGSILHLSHDRLIDRFLFPYWYR